MAALTQEEKMKNLISRLMVEEDGATIIEYVLLAALISVVAITAITLIGQNVNKKYEDVSGAVSK